MDNIIKELEKLYSKTQFKASHRDDRKILIYDNLKLEWDEGFISTVIELAEKYLSQKDLDNFSFVYDYLGEMGNKNLFQFESKKNRKFKKCYPKNINDMSIFTSVADMPIRK